MDNYHRMKSVVLDKLGTQLPEHLAYHGIQHTLDVLEVCNEYIERLNLNQEDACLLRMGALVHDMGFVETYKNHEEISAGMAAEIMSGMGINGGAIEVVKGLVMATKIPQSPTNPLEKIICDADLDYLGRDDYPEISKKLYEELKACNMIGTDEQWRDLQIKFLQGHCFHTEFAKEKREPKKQYWLNKILTDSL